MLDTNVLLNLYRYHVQARDDLLTVLEQLTENLWVPHQAILEFWNQRETVLSDPRSTEETLSQLEDYQRKSETSIRRWADRASLTTESIDELVATVRDGIGKSIRKIDAHEDGQNREFAHDTNCDEVLATLQRILFGHVGPPLPNDEHEELSEMGRERLQSELPPGFSDVKKKGLDGALGDYFLWIQVLREARRRHQDILFVTSENKQDWWRLNSKGQKRGPRVELVEEARSFAGVRLFMLQPDGLLKHAVSTLGIPVHEQSARYVAQVDSSLSSHATLVNGGWTPESVHELLERLDNEAPVQANAIRYAAEHDGYVSRDTVYAIGEYDETRTLRRFILPVWRVTQELRERGSIPSGAIDILSTDYRFGRASGYTVPEELIPLIAI